MPLNPDNYHVPPVIKDLATILFSSISLVISFWALSIARKTTLKKAAKEKQFDLVIDLVNHLSKIQLYLEYQTVSDIDGQKVISLTLFYHDDFKKANLELFDGTPLFFVTNSISNYGLYQFYSNPLLPKLIFNEVMNFSNEKGNIKDRYNIEQLESVTGYYIVHNEYSNANDFKANNKYVVSSEYPDFESYYNALLKLFSSINNWLDEHEASDIKFRKSYFVK